MIRSMLLIGVMALIAGEDLVVNGSFERADPDDSAAPLAWERPDGLGVAWLEAPLAGGAPRGHALRLDTRVPERDLVASWRRAGITGWDIPQAAANPVAETYGLSVYGDPIPVRRGQAYRLSWWWLGPPSGIKVWVRGYARVAEDVLAVTATATGAAGRPPVGTTRRRRLYEAVAGGDAYVTGDDGVWHHARHVFNPTRNTPAVSEMRIMLYAFYPPRAYWFDDLCLEPIDEDAYARERARR